METLNPKLYFFIKDFSIKLIIMKQIAYFLQIIGSAILILFIIRMFGGFETYITTDKQFLLMLFGGIFTSCFGFLLYEYNTTPELEYLKNIRKMQIKYMIYSCICCMIFIVACLFM